MKAAGEQVTLLSPSGEAQDSHSRMFHHGVRELEGLAQTSLIEGCAQGALIPWHLLSRDSPQVWGHKCWQLRTEMVSTGTSLVAQLVKEPPAVRGTWV